MIDSHAHVGDPRFDSDREEVLSRARAAGVEAIVCIGQDLPSTERALSLRRGGFPGLVLASTAGLHPHEARHAHDQWSALADLARLPEVAAVGETGLDFHYDHSPRDQQRASFRTHLALAREIGKPVVVHVRESHREALEDVGAEGRGAEIVIHCFTGTPEEARRWLDLGASISFSGILTFPSAADLRRAALDVPAERLLVETDAPYLAPRPVRGSRCEPAMVAHTLGLLAEIRGEPREEVERATAENAVRLFLRDRGRELDARTSAPAG